jgi:hypothetical protein
MTFPSASFTDLKPSTIRNRILNFALEIVEENPKAGEAPIGTLPIAPERTDQIFNHTLIVHGNGVVSPGVMLETDDDGLIIHSHGFQATAFCCVLPWTFSIRVPRSLESGPVRNIWK